MLAESALCIVHGLQSLPGRSMGFGFLTPATAFGHVLAKRLQAAGIRFETSAAEAKGTGKTPEVQWQDYAPPS